MLVLISFFITTLVYTNNKKIYDDEEGAYIYDEDYRNFEAELQAPIITGDVSLNPSI